MASTLPYPKGDTHRKGNGSTRRIGMAYVIAEPCIDVKDKACVEARHRRAPPEDRSGLRYEMGAGRQWSVDR